MPVNTSETVSYYEEHGYLPAFPVLNRGESAELRAMFDRMEESVGKENAAYSLHNRHLEDRRVLELAAHPALLGPLQGVLGPDVILLDSRFICKYPSEDDGKPDRYVAWHQDMRYWGIDGHVVSAWLAVDDADTGNGCMTVIPGTHTSGVYDHQKAVLPGNLLSNDQEIPSHLFRADGAVPVPVPTGHSSLHHGLLIHGSEPNRSTRRRCGFVIRYTSASGRPVQDPDRPRTFPATVLLSGNDVHQNFIDHAPEWFKESRD